MHHLGLWYVFFIFFFSFLLIYCCCFFFGFFCLVLCCLSLDICLAPISLSLPYFYPIILFIPRITLYFHLSQIPWSLCDPYALPLPCVLSLLIFSISYSSCFMYISNPSLYALLISVLLIFHHLLIYPLPCLLLISNIHF